jgi:alpha-glucosidase
VQEWWRGAVIYQIYPRSFADANGDGVGDLVGICERLDYVAALGVDAIWLSPFFVSPMKDFGYDVADYCDVDPLFGSLADFDRLLEQAHRRDLRVIIDQVYSHSSDAHPWFDESRQSRDNPKADWYVWADPKPDGMPPNNWLSVFGGVTWEWEPRRRQYFLHNFLKEQPDLNFHNREVQDAALRAAEFWLARGVDGFRIDVANFFCHDLHLRDNPPKPHPAPDKPYWLQRPIYNRTRPETLGFVARFRALLDRYPHRMAVAEIAAEDQIGTMVDYTSGPDRYHTAYSFVLMRDEFGPSVFRDAVEEMLDRGATAWPAWAFSNHDVVRAVSRWGADDEGNDSRAKLLVALLTSLRGTIFLYQGEELGLPQAEVPFERLQDPEGKAFWPRHRGRDGARTPMPWRGDMPHAGFCPERVEPWLPVDHRHLSLAVDRQQADPQSTLAFTQAFLAWRKAHPALMRGEILFLDGPAPVLAFERAGGGERVTCAFNLSGERSRIELAAVVNEGETLDAPCTSGSIDAGTLLLPPWGCWFFRQV